MRPYFLLITSAMLSALCLFFSHANAQTPSPLFAPTQLQCEYLVDAIGIDAPAPRFTWQLPAGLRLDGGGVMLMMSLDSGAVRQALTTPDPSTIANCYWQVQSIRIQRIVYAGPPLAPFTRYYWAIRMIPGSMNSPQEVIAQLAFFETGLMNTANWKGAWISDNKGPSAKEAPYFRRSFLVDKQIVSARAYVSAAGLFELSINGSKTGDHLLDPMYTRFDRRLLYVSFDVTRQLLPGNNVVGVVLGNGWFNHQSTAVWDFDRAPWRARPAFCLDLRITYTDGSVETISSGKEWKTGSGGIIFNSIYTAEHQDANKAIAGWNTSLFNDSAWTPVIFRSAPASLIVSQAMQPIRAVDTIAAISVRRFSDSNYVFDLGRNIAGITRIFVMGTAGTVIRIRHAERLYPNGHTDLSNIDVHYRPTDDSDPFQTDIFILKGTGAPELFQPLFNYKGFQYIEISSSKPVRLDRESLTGYFMHSDVKPLSTLQSSNPVIDAIWRATNHSYLSNLMGYPTDCPQREKNGWTGDAHIAVETGLYNFDGITIYEKWLADHRDEQQPNGVLPSIIPTDGWGYEWGNGPDWTSSIALIPWNIFLFYGDTLLLSKSYQPMKRYVDHLHSISPADLTGWGLGDWVPVKTKTPVELTSSAYYYADVRILAQAAALLGKAADQQFYDSLASQIRDAFNYKYYANGLYAEGSQTALSMALYWGLVPDSLKQRVADALARRVLADNKHLDVGLLGTKCILNALSENGYAELAYQVAAQEDFPSWGWWIKNGATTLYENWPIDASSDISMNHIMFGEIGAWLFKGLGGIFPDPAQPGFKHILLRPNLVKGLDEFTCSHRGPYGLIRSGWKRTRKTLQYEVTIPSNSTATLWLPLSRKKNLFRNGRKITSQSNMSIYTLELNAGTYLYEWR